MKITDERAELALRFLVDNDEKAAELKADAERAEFKAKAIKDALFRRLTGSVADRTAEAGASAEYAMAMGDYFNALAEYEKVRNKRSTETIVIETWRTVQANQRRGNI